MVALKSQQVNLVALESNSLAHKTSSNDIKINTRSTLNLLMTRRSNSRYAKPFRPF